MTLQRDESEFASSRRIAFNAGIRSIGEILAKLASIVFFIAIARELGQATFGEFIFGLSLCSVLFMLAAFGTDELLQREISRDHAKADEMLANVLAMRIGLLIALSGVVLAITTIIGYSVSSRIAVLLIGAGVGIELITAAYYHVLMGYERMTYVSATLIVQRVSTAAMAFGVLALGGGLLEVSAVFALGALFGLVTSIYLMRTRVVRPAMRVDRDRWLPLFRAGIPLGISIMLFTALLKLDAALLAILADNEAVGAYGAAYRLVEATMFLSWSFSGAILPWLSRQGEGGERTLARGFELGLKALTAVLLPIAVVYAVAAEPLIETLYGSEFSDAIEPLRWLAAMTVLYGINTYAATVLIARDKPLAFARSAGLVIVQNVAFNLVLIPTYGATGAAFNAVLSGLILAAMSLHAANRVAGPASFVRALAAPLTAAAAMTLTMLAFGGDYLIAAPVGGIVFIAVLLGLERLAAPRDFEMYRQMARSIRARGRPVGPPPGEVGGID